MDYVREHVLPLTNMLDVCLSLEPSFFSLEDLTFFDSLDFIHLLGKEFSAKDIDAIREFSKSIIWCTYRRNWPSPIGGFGGPNTDRGWGCMIRCGQMLLAQCLSIIHLGTEWRWTGIRCSLDESDQLLIKYRRLLRLFQDKRTAQYSIHQIAQLGVSEGKQVGQWLGPNTMAQVLKKLVIYDEWSQLVVHVAMDNVLISSDVRTVAAQRLPAVEVEGENQQKIGANQGDDAKKDGGDIGDCRWKRPLLLIVPLRLGLTAINACYLDAIVEFFKLPHCVGILGGRPNHAVYFYGIAGRRLLYLDPHICQEFQDLDEQLPTLVAQSTSESSSVSAVPPLSAKSNTTADVFTELVQRSSGNDDDHSNQSTSSRHSDHFSSSSSALVGKLHQQLTPFAPSETEGLVHLQPQQQQQPEWHSTTASTSNTRGEELPPILLDDLPLLLPSPFTPSLSPHSSSASALNSHASSSSFDNADLLSDGGNRGSGGGAISFPTSSSMSKQSTSPSSSSSSSSSSRSGHSSSPVNISSAIVHQRPFINVMSFIDAFLPSSYNAFSAADPSAADSGTLKRKEDLLQFGEHIIDPTPKINTNVTVNRHREEANCDDDLEQEQNTPGFCKIAAACSSEPMTNGHTDGSCCSSSSSSASAAKGKQVDIASTNDRQEQKGKGSSDEGAEKSNDTDDVDNNGNGKKSHPVADAETNAFNRATVVMPATSFDDSSFHCPYLLSMDFDSLDPSLALGFLVRNSAEYDDLVNQLRVCVLPSSSPPLFEILNSRPKEWPEFSLETTYLYDNPLDIKEYDDLQYDSDEQFELLE